jgi:hypothetical protein
MKGQKIGTKDPIRKPSGINLIATVHGVVFEFFAKAFDPREAF